MNNIKFRVWDKTLQKFINWNSISAHNFNSEEYIYQQWTGLLDKNEKEIHLGDILKVTSTTQEFGESPATKTRHSKVIWYKEGAFWEEYIDWFYTSSGNKDGLPVVGWIDPSESEVIGNILQNTDLLKC